MVIETKRLILRGFQESDYDDVYEFLSQRKYDTFEAYPDITYENAIEHLKYRIGNDSFIAIELKETGKIIGNIFFADTQQSTKELGYIINKNYQRKDYATEAIKIILTDAFQNGLHRVYAECAPENTCSWGLLESLGFRREAHFKKNVSFIKDEDGNPIWWDTLIYAILEEEWE